MKNYRCYFMRDDHIAAVEAFESADDGAAMLNGARLLEDATYLAIEIWQQERQIGRLSKSAGS